VGGTEQRSEARVDIEIAVDFGSDHNFYTGLTHNIGAGGLFIATNKLRPVGTRLVVNFTLTGQSDPIQVTMEVRWLSQPPARSRDSGSTGMGLKFVDISEKALAAVTEFTHKRETLFYDDE
jgi:uncharacterized protein (TIGR02266 family)